MKREFLRAAIFDRYGVTMYVGIGVPIPILDVEMVKQTAVTNHDIKANITDYSVPKRSRPSYGQVSYAELRSGSITINGKTAPTAPLSSLGQARKIAGILKDWIAKGEFTLTEPVQHLPIDNKMNTLEVWDEDSSTPAGPGQ